VILHPAPEALERARAERGTAFEGADLIRMEPGHVYPAHLHLCVEEVLVLSGGNRDEGGVYEAGTYVRYEPGSQHVPVALGDRSRPHGSENPACVLFATARAGIELLP
jgi:anti-sigma factor ChrR (cupin superfamily)